MTTPTLRVTHGSLVLLALFFVLVVGSRSFAQENLAQQGKQIYDQIKEFQLTGDSVQVKGFTLKRDRASLIFDGTFYLASPVAGRITGAVFIGEGRINAPVPPSDFEKENVRRLLGAEVVESDFRTAVLRFTDDTADLINQNSSQAGVTSDRALRLAAEIDGRLLKETGANLPARMTLSLVNKENPGFFFAHFEGGKRGRFSYVLDYQNRIPVANFTLNAGEKGMFFSYESAIYGNTVWMAFYGVEDYEKRVVNYSDTNDLIDVSRYDLNLDLREHRRRLSLLARVEANVIHPNLRAVSFQIGESLGEYDSVRLKKQLRLKNVRVGGLEQEPIQEDWEGGFTVFLPTVAHAGEKLEFEFVLEGDFMYDAQNARDCYYPRSTTSWFPRHGYLDRATFDLTFRHPKRLRIASVGERLVEEPDPDDKDTFVSKFRMRHPVALITFALGPFERHKQLMRLDQGGKGEQIDVEFNSLPGSIMAIKEDFIVAELDNSLRYFTVLFGEYPYPVFGAAFHPFGFGQGFPSLLMIPRTDRASKYTYAFVAHETAHQWWGNIVAWRSYRDQWLSEGFAEYSGILYTGLRASQGARDDLLGTLRSSLKDPPVTTTGIGKGRLVDVGPIILGHRLNSPKTLGAYQTLIYNKGALVLRMLHFLLSDPATGNDEAFFAMMTDFVERHRNKFASTDDFRVVAGEHFARSPVGKRYNLKDLDWFFNQWVYQSAFPSYEIQYQVQDQPDGKVLLTGTVTQQNVPDNWFMVLPLVLSFGANQHARGTVHALGPTAEFKIPLPMRPRKVELDPHHWIIAEKKSVKGR